MTEHPVSADETLRFTGSAMIVVAENVNTVREILRNDIYAASGVWDVDNVTIYPVWTIIFSYLLFFGF